MKVFIIFFCIFLTAKGTPLKSENDDHLKSATRTLINRIAAINNSIKQSRDAIDAVPEKSKKEITRLIDSEFLNYPRIFKLQKETNERAATKGFSYCRRFFNVRVEDAKEDLEKKLTNAIKTQLRNNELTLYSTEQDIAKILNNLQGENLDKELALCKNSDECNLTGKYVTVVKQSEIIISNIKNITDLVVQFVYVVKIKEKGLCEESQNVQNYLYHAGCNENKIDSKACSNL